VETRRKISFNNIMNQGSWESTWTWAKLRLLLVDDAPTIRRLIGDWLENDGHYVETAADGLQGLENSKQERGFGDYRSRNAGA
jgi:PleD family two-component response regulator